MGPGYGPHRRSDVYISDASALFDSSNLLHDLKFVDQHFPFSGTLPDSDLPRSELYETTFSTFRGTRLDRRVTVNISTKELGEMGWDSFRGPEDRSSRERALGAKTLSLIDGANTEGWEYPAFLAAVEHHNRAPTEFLLSVENLPSDLPTEEEYGSGHLSISMWCREEDLAWSNPQDKFLRALDSVIGYARIAAVSDALHAEMTIPLEAEPDRMKELMFEGFFLPDRLEEGPIFHRLMPRSFPLHLRFSKGREVVDFQEHKEVSVVRIPTELPPVIQSGDSQIEATWPLNECRLAYQALQAKIQMNVSYRSGSTLFDQSHDQSIQSPEMLEDERKDAARLLEEKLGREPSDKEVDLILAELHAEQSGPESLGEVLGGLSASGPKPPLQPRKEGGSQWNGPYFEIRVDHSQDYAALARRYLMAMLHGFQEYVRIPDQVNRIKHPRM